MSIDQTTKRQHLAQNVVIQATRMIDALNELLILKEEFTNSSMTFSGSDFSIDGLQHLDANAIAVLFTSADATKTYMNGQGYTAAFEAAKA